MASGTSETRLGPSPSHPVDIVGFAPGTVLADRYRIVAMVGRGGMGEVYRADDLRLGQPVALKFLPHALEHDSAARDRLLAEVRNARLVSHPNVCRVFDVGEVQGRYFLTMEYIDGEDLASLLRRIGRLPATKALEVARQLCAGLAAAHDRGVLHRDLKPANVMIDGRGHARVTDFGLAAEAEPSGVAGASASRGAIEVAGTVAYLAPERFEGKPATVQTDLYALGLILYEIYTGKQALSATTLEAWRRAHSDSTPSQPSAIVGEIEPAVERAILRCLEKDPVKRPPSAAQLAASLPGGDPLAAAVAAGETPSPELVAASGEEGMLPRRQAWLWFLACLGLLVAAIPLGQLWHLENLVRTKSPAEERAKAQEILKNIGYAYEAQDSYLMLYRSSTYERWAQQQSVLSFSPPPGGVIRPVNWLYRQSRQPIFTWQPFGSVSALDPAPQSEDDVVMSLTPEGTLLALIVGGLVDVSPLGVARSRTVDYTPLFAASGLVMDNFQPVPPERKPVFMADAVHAWEGKIGDQPVRIEAAAWRGNVVWWRVDPIPRPQPRSAFRTVAWTYLPLLISILLFGSMIGLAALALHNRRAGRGDTRGAVKVASVVTVGEILFLVSNRHWTYDPLTVLIFVTSLLGVAFFGGLVVWFFYLGFEPFVRRRWPHLLVAWTRVLDARWSDPLVGRSLLSGAAAALLATAVLPGLAVAAARAFNVPFAIPWSARFLPPESVVAWLLASEQMPFVGPALAVIGVGFLVVGRLVARCDWGAWVVLTAGFFGISLLEIATGQFWTLAWPLAATATAVMLSVPGVILLARQGLLSFAVFLTVSIPLRNTPVTADVSAWYFWRTGVIVVIVCSLAAWGFKNVLGKQSAFPAGALD